MKQYYYTVAIDFGTARTGFAWGISSLLTKIDSIYTKEQWEGLPSNYIKTYTELYHDLQHDKWYFGGEAHQISQTGENFQEEKVIGQSFEAYKMRLYDEEEKTQENDQETSTLDLVVHTLKYIKEQVWEHMKQNLVDATSLFSRDTFEKEVQWVLTVPEGAKNEQKLL